MLTYSNKGQHLLDHPPVIITKMTSLRQTDRRWYEQIWALATKGIF